MVFLLAQYILNAALKDKIFISFVVLLVVSVSLSIFFGASALTEKDQFSIVFAAGGMRITAFFTLVLFTVFYVRRSFDTRDVEYLLSRPLSRGQFLLGHALAFSTIATVLAVLVTMAILLLPFDVSLSGLFLWGGSIWAELVIGANIALFFAFVLNSPVTAALMVSAFYALSRLMGEILGIMSQSSIEGSTAWLEKLMLLISVFIPRLDLMGQSAWLLYGATTSFSWSFIITQTIVFCGLVLSAAFIDLNRKQF